MKPKTVIPLVIGLAVGFFAIKIGIDLVQKAKGAQGDEVHVYVSAKMIDAASKITEPMLSTKRVASALVPSDAFTASKDLVGRVTSMTIVPGVPITAAMLSPPGTEPGLRAVIPPGMRAASVSVNEETAVAGFILPGSRVDVSAVPKDNGPAKLVLADVEVGAVGQSMSRVGEDGKTVRMEKSVTLFLRPEEVQILHAVSGTGRIRLALRGVAKDPGESLWTKLAQKALTARQKVAPTSGTRIESQPHVVDFVRGSEYQKLVFDSQGNMRRFASDGPMPTPNDPANSANYMQPRREVRE